MFDEDGSKDSELVPDLVMLIPQLAQFLLNAHHLVKTRVGPDLVFLAGCRISGACWIRPDMPDIRPDNPAKFKIRPDNLAGYPAK